jgi:hypothetical protein
VCPFPVRWRVNARETACAGVRAHRVNDTAWLGVGRKKGRRSGRRDGARAGAMGGGGPGDRSAQVRGREAAAVARRALGDQEGGAPSPATACTMHPTTARPWRRGHPKPGGEARREKKGPRSSLTPGLACARAGVHAGARASCPRGHARESECAGAGSRTRAARRGVRRREGQAKQTARVGISSWGSAAA